MRVVIDTNIVFSMLARGCGDLAMRVMVPSDTVFYAPRFLFVELFKHSAKILKATKLPEENVLEALNELMESLHLVESSIIPVGTWMRARQLCHDVDIKDTPFIALALHLDADLWTDDDELKIGLRAKGFYRFFEP